MSSKPSPFLLLLYELALFAALLIALPKILYMLIIQGKYRKSLFHRLGVRSSSLKESTKSSIWIHAVSVGETKAVVPVARELGRLYPDMRLIVSSATETGHAEAKRSMPFADAHLYLPFDLSWVVAPLVKKVAPKLIVLCESDFWLNFFYCSKKQGAALALVNGKLSERSRQRYRFFSFFSSRLFGLIDLFCVQNALYRDRFLTLGVPPEKMVITGNIKLDEEYPQLSSLEYEEWRNKLGMSRNHTVITAGSTHAPEEKLMISALKELQREGYKLRLILVPRHPERFKEVGQLLEKEGLSWINFSDIQKRTGEESVILMNAMGLLRLCYQLSDIAVVGGSFTEKVGGHNILEPCWYGKPVLFGPHTFTQTEFVALITSYSAGLQIAPHAFVDTLKQWLTTPEETVRIGANGLRLVREMKGGTKKTVDALVSLMNRSS